MDSPEKMPPSEKLYEAHKGLVGKDPRHWNGSAWNKKAESLHAARTAYDNFAQELKERNIISKLITRRWDRTELERLKNEQDFYQRNYDENIRIAEQHVDVYHAEALAFAEEYETYGRMQQALSEITGAEPIIRDTDQFLEAGKWGLTMKFPEPDERAKAAAAIDFLKPITDKPLEMEDSRMGTSTTHSRISLPRMDIGTSLAVALENAEKAESRDILRIRKTGMDYAVKNYPILFGNLPGREVQREEVYMPIPSEMARIFRENRYLKDELDDEISFFDKDHVGDYRAVNYYLAFEFDVFDMAEAHQLERQRHAMLKMDLVDAATGVSESRDIPIEASDVRNLYDQVVRAVLDSEMGMQQKMAKNVRVEVNGEDVPFEELQAIVSGKGIAE